MYKLYARAYSLYDPASIIYVSRIYSHKFRVQFGVNQTVLNFKHIFAFQENAVIHGKIYITKPGERHFTDDTFNACSGMVKFELFQLNLSAMFCISLIDIQLNIVLGHYFPSVAWWHLAIIWTDVDTWLRSRKTWKSFSAFDIVILAMNLCQKKSHYIIGLTVCCF